MIDTFLMEINMELISLYPFDPTGRSPDNKIQDESITVIPPAEIKDYSYVIPRAAPFYADTLVVRDGIGPGSRRLIENVDYWCVIDFLSASHSLQRRVSVGIALLDARYSGTLYVTYQTVGGNYTLADYSVLEELIRERYIVKHVSYEQIINLPEGFAPDWHAHQVADMVGMSEVVGKLSEMISAIMGNAGSFGQLAACVDDHLNKTLAHRPENVGLGNVRNYGVATAEDIYDGNSLKYVTADMLNYYVSQQTGRPPIRPQGDLDGLTPLQKVVNLTQSVQYNDKELSTEWYVQYSPSSRILTGNITINTPFIFKPAHNLNLNITSNVGSSPTTFPLVNFNTNVKQLGEHVNFTLFNERTVFGINDSNCLSVVLQSHGDVEVNIGSLTLFFTATVPDSETSVMLLDFLNGVNV